MFDHSKLFEVSFGGFVEVAQFGDDHVVENDCHPLFSGLLWPTSVNGVLVGDDEGSFWGDCVYHF